MRELRVLLAVLFFAFSTFAQSAEHGQNLRTCLNGYSALCDHSQLTASEAGRVAEAEHGQNLRACLNGYSALCDHSKLTASESSNVAAQPVLPVPWVAPGIAENGSYYGEPNAN